MQETTLTSVLRTWWRDERKRTPMAGALRKFAGIMWEFLRDSLPDRKRRRYGDADYDWEHRVNTTSGGLGWRARLIGYFNSEYQPMEENLFHEMLNGLGIEFTGFTFVDIGSGKGRALLMASAYPFRRIIGVELLSELNQIAQDNIRGYANPQQQCSRLEAILGDATRFAFPPEPLVVYLFHPLPESGFATVLDNLVNSSRQTPRPIFMIYANPVFERLVSQRHIFEKLGGTHQYSLFRLVSNGTPDEVAASNQE